MVDAQAEDPRLWAVVGTTERERTLQEALRELHAMVERAT